ncbi:DNA repair protein RadA [endosymbiont 'TC1' of Trimyema compressum]|uniref:DNA repair protein RadA n=1 Tax=endosymbiont 'TC1' of Trimyema compressum TaxID=243899 RepID=UPI000B329C86
MKHKTHYFCQECGSISQKWLGKCPGCQSWNSFVKETIFEEGKGQVPIGEKEFRKSTLLKEVSIEDYKRKETGIKELDRVLGGGIVKGSLSLISGDPGIGKSTLLIQVASTLGTNEKVLYISGEESLRQIKMRAERLGLEGKQLYLLAENNMMGILESIKTIDPNYIIVDSIQTVYMEDMSGAPGSVGQVRESTLALMKVAKGQGRTVFVVGHVTKSGNIAGPKVLEHMVDTVLYLEGDKDYFYRLIRSGKNRFGSTDEIGVFEMSKEGLREIANPSQYFLSDGTAPVPGSVIVPILEGTRALLVELQALTTETSFAVPRRLATGLDTNRVLLLTAVLEKKIRFAMGKNDIYFNVVGGLKVDDRGLDLGICIALISSLYNVPIHKDTLLVGEVGLTGEVRGVYQLEKRIQEGEKLGFEKIIVPKNNKIKKNTYGIDVIPVETIQEAVSLFFKREK